jgi:ADP-ribosyl-[dinitrogen reductase] hydrolase
LLSPGFCPVPGIWNEVPRAPKIAAVAASSFKAKDPPGIGGTGYVVDCLEAALRAFYRSESFQEGALLAVNLGDDAYTTGAVYGQIAGAFYGKQGVPIAWRSRLAYRELIERCAEQLCALARPTLAACI